VVPSKIKSASHGQVKKRSDKYERKEVDRKSNNRREMSEISSIRPSRHAKKVKFIKSGDRQPEFALYGQMMTPFM